MIFFSLYAEASGIFAAFAANTIFFAFHVPRGNERDYKIFYLTFRPMLSISTLVKSRITSQNVYKVRLNKLNMIQQFSLG